MCGLGVLPIKFGQVNSNMKKTKEIRTKLIALNILGIIVLLFSVIVLPPVIVSSNNNKIFFKSLYGKKLLVLNIQYLKSVGYKKESIPTKYGARNVYNIVFISNNKNEQELNGRIFSTQSINKAKDVANKINRLAGDHSYSFFIFPGAIFCIIGFGLIGFGLIALHLFPLRRRASVKGARGSP